MLRYEPLPEVEHRLRGLVIQHDESTRRLNAAVVCLRRLRSRGVGDVEADARRRSRDTPRTASETYRRVRLKQQKAVVATLRAAVRNFAEAVDVSGDVLADARRSGNSSAMTDNVEELVDFDGESSTASERIRERRRDVEALRSRATSLRSLLTTFDPADERWLRAKRKLVACEWEEKSVGYLIGRMTIMVKHYENRETVADADDDDDEDAVRRGKKILHELLVEKDKAMASLRKRIASAKARGRSTSDPDDDSTLLNDYADRVKVLKREAETARRYAGRPRAEIEVAMETTRYDARAALARKRAERVIADVGRDGITAAEATARLIGLEQVIEDAERRLQLVGERRGPEQQRLRPTEDELRAKLIAYARDERKCRLAVAALNDKRRRADETRRRRRRRAAKCVGARDYVAELVGLNDRRFVLSREVTRLLTSLGVSGDAGPPGAGARAAGADLRVDIATYRRRIDVVTELIANHDVDRNGEGGFERMQTYINTIKEYQSKIERCLEQLEILVINETYSEHKHVYALDYTNEGSGDIAARDNTGGATEEHLRISEIGRKFSTEREIRDALETNRRRQVELLVELRAIEAERKRNPGAKIRKKRIKYFAGLSSSYEESLKRDVDLGAALSQRYDGDAERLRRANAVHAVRKDIEHVEALDARICRRYMRNEATAKSYAAERKSNARRRASLQEKLSRAKTFSSAVASQPEEYVDLKAFFKRFAAGLPMPWEADDLPKVAFYENAEVNLEHLRIGLTPGGAAYREWSTHIAVVRRKLAKQKLIRQLRQNDNKAKKDCKKAKKEAKLEAKRKAKKEAKKKAKKEAKKEAMKEAIREGKKEAEKKAEKEAKKEAMKEAIREGKKEAEKEVIKQESKKESNKMETAQTYSGKRTSSEELFLISNPAKLFRSNSETSVAAPSFDATARFHSTTDVLSDRAAIEDNPDTRDEGTDSRPPETVK